MATGVTSKLRRSNDVACELNYPGKLLAADVLESAGREPAAVRLTDEEIRLYRGDSLDSLLWLRASRTTDDLVRCVYIDPPYATSRAFVDRDVRHAYDDVLQGAEYVEYLRRCLIVLHDLLADNGVIFVHLDQTMVFEIKLVMDEVFGRKSFRNLITRKKCNTKNYTRRQFGCISDHILFYSRGADYVWHRVYDPWSDVRLAEEYPYTDAATGRRFKRVPVHAPGVRNGATGQPWRGKLPPPGKHWQYTPKKLDALDAAGEIYWSPNGNPRRIVFFDPEKGIPAQDIWMQFKDAHNQNIHVTGYPTEKNYDLLRRIIGATTDRGDLVLDAFCGSGTTLEAARELGRRAIGIDASEAAIAATCKRLATGRQRMGDFVTAVAESRKKSRQPRLFDDRAGD